MQKSHVIEMISEAIRDAGDDDITCISLADHHQKIALVMKSSNQRIARIIAHAMIEDEDLYKIITEAIQIYNMDVIRRTKQN